MVYLHNFVVRGRYISIHKTCDFLLGFLQKSNSYHGRQPAGRLILFAFFFEIFFFVSQTSPNDNCRAYEGYYNTIVRTRVNYSEIILFFFFCRHFVRTLSPFIEVFYRPLIVISMYQYVLVLLTDFATMRTR